MKKRSHLKFPSDMEREIRLGRYMSENRTPAEIAAYRRALADVREIEGESGATSIEMLTRYAADEALQMGEREAYNVLWAASRAMAVGPHACWVLGPALHDWVSRYISRQSAPLDLPSPKPEPPKRGFRVWPSWRSDRTQK